MMFKDVVSQSSRPLFSSGVARGAIFCFLAVFGTSVSCAMAQGAASMPGPAQASAKLSNPPVALKPSTPPKMSFRPAWQDLTPAQQLSLKPLAVNWGTMAEAEKRKWIAMAANYSALAPAEQLKMHSRMTEWSSLSQQQRTQARLNFAKSKQLSPAQKAATWEAYQALSPEEKKKLATSAPAKPKGAAAATKPVPPQKLAKIPVIKQIQKRTPNTAASAPAVDRKTLLPRLQPPSEPTPAQKN